MKTRQGFVSNSSSSSFIVSNKEYSSVFDLAKAMIPARDWEDDQALIRKIEESEIKGMDPNTGVSFNSCNYETYITKYQDYYLVSTCNNHDWDIESTGHFPKEIAELCDSDYENLEQVVPRLSPFWFPEYNIGGSLTSKKNVPYDTTYCNEHFLPLIDVNGIDKPICPACNFNKEQKKENKKKNKKWESKSILEKISFVEDKIIEIDKSLSADDKKKIYETLEEAKKSLKG